MQIFCEKKFFRKINFFYWGEWIEAIIIIDEYADITFLDLIRNIKCNITLITRDSNRLSNIEIEKYNKEYNNLKVVRNNSFHDRYFILDRKEIYLLGSSINNIGDKTSMIIKLEDKLIIETLLENVENIIKNILWKFSKICWRGQNFMLIWL